MFALVDCNSFYASCEQIFRPDLRQKPVVVLSNNDGFVVARTQEAKKLGIGNLQPFFKVQGLLEKHNVAIFSSNYPLYGDISNRVIHTLRGMSPEIEVYSIDEMFLSLRGERAVIENAQEIRAKLWRDIRMPVGVGVAPTKTLAKVANKRAKAYRELNGVCLLDAPHKWEPVLAETPTAELWGVATRMAERLARLNIHTALDLAQANPAHIRKHTNIGVAHTLRELNGISCLALEETVSPRKQIYCTRSFGKKAQSIEPVLEALSVYAARACEKLRSQNSLALSIHVFIHTSPFESNFHSVSRVADLPYPTSDTRVVTALVRKLAREMYTKGHRFLKAGVGLTKLVPNTIVQQNIFGQAQTAQDSQIMATLDQVNDRLGRGTLFLAAQGVSKPWYMRQHYTSPEYTTRWTDIPQIRC